MDYRNFGAVDFILDGYFQEWVLNPGPESDRFWQNWIRQNPDCKDKVEKARAIMLGMDFEGVDRKEFNKENILQNITAAIKTEELADELDISRENEEYVVNDEAEETVIYSLPTTGTGNKVWYRIGLATAACVVLLLGIWVIFSTQSSIRHTTAFGETKNFRLPDGSYVMLNANSTISYPDHWDQHGDREVKLTGEGFFSIIHKGNSQKFIVHSNGVAIEVLGTEFNVNNRRGKTQVVLKSGKVQLNLAKDPAPGKADDFLNMKPGDLVEVSGEDGKITKRVVNPEKYASWTRDILIFDNTPLSEVFEMIQDIYGYDVMVEDEGIGRKIFDGEISSKDINLIITILSRSFSLEIKKQGNELIVKQRK